MFRPAYALCVVALAAVVFALAPSTARAAVQFMPSGNMTVTVVVDDDGDTVSGAPANHKWQVIQETGPTPGTTTSLGLRTIAPAAGESYNGVMPTTTGASAVYGVCTRSQGDLSLDCEARNGYSFAEIVITSGAGSDFVDASRATMPVQLSGGEGNDLLIGGAGNDYLVGGNGDDTIDGNCGLDTMFGSAGRDTLAYGLARAFTPCAAHAAGVYVAINGSPDDVDGENISTSSNFEALTGTGGGDVFILGAAPMTVTTNDGDDVVEARNGVADVISCGNGTDRAVVDAAAIDASVTGCEELERPAAPTPATPTPTQPAPVAQGGCKADQKVLLVNNARLCSDAQTQAAGGLVQLRGNVSVDGFLKFTMTGPLVVDVARRTATYAKADVVSVRTGSTDSTVLRDSTKGSFPLAANFAITSEGAVPAVQIGNVAMGAFDGKTGYISSGYAKDLRLQVSTSAASATYAAGAQFLNRTLAATGVAGFGKAGPISTVRGCLATALPLGGVSRITELRDSCISYSPAYGKWELTAKATLAGMLTTTIAARTADGPDIDEYEMSFEGKSSPIGYSTDVNAGSIRVSGLKDPEKRMRINGYVGAGWSSIPGSSAGAELHVYGNLNLDVSRRELNIQGTGVLTVGGKEMTSGDIDLTVATGTPEVPAALNANVNISALGGFLTGSAHVTIDGSGFFASGKMTVGFPAGAPITNQVNSTIRSVLVCDWGFTDWCPYITGWTTSAEAAVSNKGLGARANISVLYGTFWWIGSNNSFHVDLGFGSSRQLIDALRSRRGGGPFVPAALRAGPETVDAAGGKTSTWTIPAAAKIASLQLDGSTTGQLKVTDPSGRVVLDTATGVQVDGVGFGRDPKGTGRASFGLFAPALKPGTWTVSTAAAAPFTSVDPLMSLPQAQGKVASAKVVGAPAGTRALTSGSSKLRIAYTVPTGTRVSLRASTLDGTTTKPVAAARAKGGVVTWTVSRAWAGKLRIVAVTERDGIPVATETFATVFDVSRPVLAAPAKVVAKRAKRGAVAMSWKPVRGAGSYEVSVCVGAARTATRLVTTAPRLLLTPRTALGMRMRVRARTPNSSGRWSAPTRIAAAQPAKVTGPKRVLQPSCAL